MKRFRFLVIALTIGLAFLIVQTAMAFPPLPSSFYGMAKINGVNVPGGTIVTARINGVSYASAVVETYQGNTVYSLDVPGDQSDTSDIIEGGVEGDTILFFLGGIQANETGTWHQGTNTYLNLSGNPVGPTAFTNYLPLVIR